jgi:hypothetical protein
MIVVKAKKKEKEKKPPKGLQDPQGNPAPKKKRGRPRKNPQ